MNKGLKRFLSVALSAVMVASSLTFAGVTGVTAAESVNIYACEGVQEAAYVEWAAVAGTSRYYVSYSKDGSNFTQIDDELIRKYPDRWRADLIGLSAGNYTVKVTCKDASGNTVAEATSQCNVVAQDRTGFTFSPKSIAYDNGGCGAYNADGTLKSDATVLYITEKNFDTVSLTLTNKDGKSYTATGLADITKTMGGAATKGHSNPPLAVRFLGTIGENHADLASPNTLETKSDKGDAKVNITFEGVGEDTIFDGLALRLNGVANCEIRNISFWNWHDDGIQLQGNPNSNHWIHNNDLFYGENHGGDQEKGDGSTDIKDDSKYTTYSYNHYWDCGKTSLCGMKGESGDNYITYHHNWFDHSDSRHPRIRTMFVHVYNNYYDGVSKYGVGAAQNSSAFVEGNYFRNTKYPMLSSMQGSDMNGGKGTFSGENGGIIKAYNNYIEGGYGVVYYDAATTPVEFDAYLASSRDEQVPSAVKAKQGGKTFDNSNVDSYILSIPVEEPEVAKDKAVKYAGRIGNDFNWAFNNAVDDTDYEINTALASAIQAYVKDTSDDYVSIGGSSDGSGPVPTESTTELTTETTTEAATETTTYSAPVQIGEAQTSGALSGISVTYNASTNTWDLKDTSSTDAADITIPFEEQTKGKVVISGTVKPGTTASKWAFIQIKGKNSAGVESEILGIGGGAAKTELSVRLNGSATWNKIGTFSAKDYKYTVIFDLDNKTVDADIDGIKYSGSVDVSSVSSVSSTTSKTQSRNVSLSVPYVGVLGAAPAPDTTTEATTAKAPETTEATTAATTVATTEATTAKAPETTEATTETTTEATTANVETSSETTTEKVDPTPGVYGDVDVDGDRDIVDCQVLIEQIRNGYVEPVAGRNDVTLDGQVDSADVATILQKILNNSYMMPCEKETSAETTTEAITEATTAKAPETTEATTVAPEPTTVAPEPTTVTEATTEATTVAPEPTTVTEATTEAVTTEPTTSSAQSEGSAPDLPATLPAGETANMSVPFGTTLGGKNLNIKVTFTTDAYVGQGAIITLQYASDVGMSDSAIKLRINSTKDGSCVIDSNRTSTIGTLNLGANNVFDVTANTETGSVTASLNGGTPCTFTDANIAKGLVSVKIQAKNDSKKGSRTTTVSEIKWTGNEGVNAPVVEPTTQATTSEVPTESTTASGPVEPATGADFYDFNDSPVITKDGTSGIIYTVSTKAGQTSDTATAIAIAEIINNALFLNDTSATDTVKATLPLNEKSSGVVSYKATITPSAAKGNWTVLQLNGPKADGTVGEVLGLRIDKQKNYGIRVNAADTVTATTTAVAAGSAITAVITVDFDNDTASLSVNGGTPVTVTGVDAASISSMSFQTATDARTLTVDDAGMVM